MTNHGEQDKTARKTGNGAGRDVKWLAAILCVHVVLAGVYWHYTPFGAPPDEGPHGLYVQILAEEHRLPVFHASDRQGYEFHQPPLYYLMGLPFYVAGKTAGIDEPAAMVRLLSVLLGALSIFVVYAVVLNAFPQDRKLALGSAGFAALLPTHVMLSSSVSNDILAEVIFGLALLVMARIIVRGPSPWRAIGLGAILGIGLMTKTTCVLLFPAAIVAYTLAWRRGLIRVAPAIGHVGALLGIGIALGGWWLVRNQVLYGDLLAMRQFRQAFGHTATPEYWLERGFSAGEYWILVGAWTFCSFWGVFGHMRVFMPTWTYVGLAAASIGVAISSVREQLDMRGESAQNRDILLIYGVVLFLVLLAFLRFNVSFFQAQGRYFYPALVPISAFWVIGVRRLLPARIWLCLAVGIPFAVQIVALATCVAPRMPYYL